jgi:hypothetical protein
VTAVVPAARPGALALGRAAALLVLVSAAVHLLQVSSGGVGALLMATMALACLPCAWHLWHAPTPTAWALTVAVDAVMLLLHGPLVAHHPGHGGGLAVAGLTLVAGQLVLAAAALLRRTSSGVRP